jgi:hypothetical protein
VGESEGPPMTAVCLRSSAGPGTSNPVCRLLRGAVYRQISIKEHETSIQVIRLTSFRLVSRLLSVSREPKRPRTPVMMFPSGARGRGMIGLKSLERSSFTPY